MEGRINGRTECLGPRPCGWPTAACGWPTAACGWPPGACGWRVAPSQPGGRRVTQLHIMHGKWRR
eukprot:4298040-Prorocentrum_lima.AAC.1